MTEKKRSAEGTLKGLVVLAVSMLVIFSLTTQCLCGKEVDKEGFIEIVVETCYQLNISPSQLSPFSPMPPKFMSTMLKVARKKGYDPRSAKSFYEKLKNNPTEGIEIYREITRRLNELYDKQKAAKRRQRRR